MDKKTTIKVAKIIILVIGATIFATAMLHTWFPLKDCKRLNDEAWPLRWVDPDRCWQSDHQPMIMPSK